jgi:hypothetical protein
VARIEGLDKLERTLSKLAGKYSEEGKMSVVVGCTQRYALHVHENMQARHNVGQAKFLESPAIEMQKELAEDITTAMSRGAKILVALRLAGTKLMRIAQLLTPVDTSALKSSFFVVEEENLEAKSDEMFQKSEATRRVTAAKHAKMSKKKIAGVKARQRATWLHAMGRQGY